MFNPLLKKSSKDILDELLFICQNRNASEWTDIDERFELE